MASVESSSSMVPGGIVVQGLSSVEGIGRLFGIDRSCKFADPVSFEENGGYLED